MLWARRPTLQGTLAIFVMTVPLAAAAVASLATNRPQPMSDVPERPGLAFHQYLVDLGAVRPAEDVAARFMFTNVGPTPVTIQAIVPSCGCLKPLLRKKTFAPGRSGDCLARIRTAGERAGPHEYSLTVKYSDPQPREEYLTFRVNLPENQVFIHPRALVFYQLNGHPTTQEVVITDYRPRTLELLNVITPSDLVRAELGPKSRDKEGHETRSVKITVAGHVPPRAFHTAVTIATDDPTYRFLRIPLRIEGPTPKIHSQAGKVPVGPAAPR